MKTIIHNELTKLMSYSAFRVIILLHFVLFSLVVFVTSRVNITAPGISANRLFEFPFVWEFFSWVASWFNILLAILIMVITGNEYSFRTFRQHVIDGLNRYQLLSGKLMVILMIAIYSTLMVLLLGLLFGFIYTESADASEFINKSYLLLVYFVQAIAYMALGLLVVVLFRNTALAITLFLLYRFIIEPLFRTIFPKDIRLWFPMKSISNLTPTPEFLSISSGMQVNTGGKDALSLRDMGIIPDDLPVYHNLLLALGYTALFIFLASILLNRRNL